MDAHETTAVKRYGFSLAMKCNLVIVVCLVLGLGLGFIVALTTVLQFPFVLDILTWIVGAVLLVIALYNIIPQWNNYIEISPDGILFYNASYRIYSPWENIVPIVKTAGYYHSKTFELREPAASDIPFAEGVARKQAVIESRSLLPGQKNLHYPSRSIPTVSYIPKQLWSDGSLDAFFQQHAPAIIVHEERDE